MRGMGPSTVPTPPDAAWLEAQLHRLLRFGRASARRGGGAWWLDGAGRPVPERGVQTWITARMAHVFSLGVLAGVEGCAEVADVALAGLTGDLHDDEHGGWFAAVDAGGAVVDDAKQAYAHAFVLLAASSAVVARRPGADALLEEVRGVLAERFWDAAHGMYVDRLDRTFGHVDPYRGVNANMHAVEAELALADAVDDEAPRRRALGITLRVLEQAREHAWRIPEHFTPGWEPMLEHHRDQPDHPFEPFGATVGHGLEWARLALQLRDALGGDAPDVLLEGAVALFERAVADGWAADGAPGFVYTTDWDGVPVVRERMHWVLAEAILAAAALHAATGDDVHARWYGTWWQHARERFVDEASGSWQHQLAPDNTPNDTVWPGRPDLYHSVHAVLLPRLPLAPTAAAALRDGPGHAM